MAKNAGFVYTNEDLNVLDEEGNSPLFIATSNKDDNFCLYLLELGGDVNQKCSEGNTPLHKAFENGKI